MKLKSSFLFCFLIIVFISCRPKVAPNEWVVSTTTCWNTMKVTKAGAVVPRLVTPCDRMVRLPATELSAEFKTETKFGDRLAGTVELTYQWLITDPKEFISSAKSITTSPTLESDRIDPDALEAIENSVVDKLLINLVREYTPGIEASSIDELTMEREIESLSAQSFDGRGVEFRNLSINVTLSNQAEEALDVMSALRFYEASGEGDFGREIIKAKAGAPVINITNPK